MLFSVLVLVHIVVKTVARRGGKGKGNFSYSVLFIFSLWDVFTMHSLWQGAYHWWKRIYNQADKYSLKVNYVSALIKNTV